MYDDLANNYMYAGTSAKVYCLMAARGRAPVTSSLLFRHLADYTTQVNIYC